MKEEVIKLNENYSINIHNADEVRKYIIRSSEALRKGGKLFMTLREVIPNNYTILPAKLGELILAMEDYDDYISSWAYQQMDEGGDEKSNETEID